MKILKKRKDFLRAAEKGFKVVKTCLILQAVLNFCEPPSPFRLGFTATKKIGKAVVRNKTKRRLRAACLINKELFIDNIDYVFIGRHNTKDINFAELAKEMKEAIKFANKRLLNPKEKTDEDNINCNN